MRSRGFTLVEVLVALFAMALIAAFAWPALEGVMRARDAGSEAVDRSMRLVTVLSQFETDLRAVQMDDAVPGALTFDGRTLRLLRRADGGLQLVAWTLDGGSWLRWAAPPATTVVELQEAWLRSQQLAGAVPPPLRLLEGVGEVQLYCYQAGALSNCQSTRDLESATGSAAPRAQELLPSGVRLVLQIDGRTLTRDLVVAPGL